MPKFWPAPQVTRPIDAEVTIPGSKSITNRALILAAIADAPSTIHGALHSRDADLMVQALQTLGVQVEQIAPNTMRITPGALQGGTIDCGLAGTVMRFVPPVAALAEDAVHFDGDPYARNRPMGVILNALRELGISVTGDALPFSVHAHGQVRGGSISIDASGSSQFVSGLLLAGARFDEGLHLRHNGGTLPSTPHIDMTIAMLREAGVKVEQPTPHEWRVYPGPIQGRTWQIEPDLSNATPFLAAAAVTGGTVRIPHWPQHTTQPGDEFREIAEAMGCKVLLEDATLSVTGPADGALKGIDKNMADIGELTPTVAAMAALATTPSTLTGIAHLRGHETDRLAALCTEINRLGGKCEELPDGLRITPSELHAGQWLSYDDHRMATAGAIIGLRVAGIEVENIETTAKTLPDFAAMWDAMIHG